MLRLHAARLAPARGLSGRRPRAGEGMGPAEAAVSIVMAAHTTPKNAAIKLLYKGFWVEFCAEMP